MQGSLEGEKIAPVPSEIIILRPRWTSRLSSFTFFLQKFLSTSYHLQAILQLSDVAQRLH